MEGLGFEFGEGAQITDDWERHFDQLLDWLLWLEADDDASNLSHSIGWCVACLYEALPRLAHVPDPCIHL